MQQPSVGQEPVNASVAVAVRDEQIAVLCDRDVRRKVKRRPDVPDRAVVDAGRTGVRGDSMSSQRHQQLTVRCELSDGVTEVVGAEHRVIRRDRDPVRPREQTLAPRTEKVPLAVKDREGMLASAKHENSVSRIGSDADHLNHVPVRRPARPIGDDAISKLPGTEIDLIVHRVSHNRTSSLS